MNLTKPFSIIIFILILFVITSCNRFRGNSNILKKSNLIAYNVQRPLLGESSGTVREIVIVDPISSHHYYITYNRVDDYDPVWSPDGRNIIFMSTREGYRYAEGTPQYFIFNLDTKQLKMFGKELISRYPEVIKNLSIRPAWTNDGQSLLIYANRTIFIADTSGKELRPIWHCPGETSIIGEMNISPNGSILELGYMEVPPQDDSSVICLSFLDLRDNSFLNTGITIGGDLKWSADGNNCLVRTLIDRKVVWLEYSTKTKQLKKLKFPESIVYADYLYDGKIAAFESPDCKILSDLEFELVIYDPTTGARSWITKDGIRKDGLTVYHSPVK